MLKFGKSLFRTAMLLALSLSTSHAQNTQTNLSTNLTTDAGGRFSIDDNFRPGWRDVTLGTAVMFSPIGVNYDRPVVDYVVGSLQVGYMLTGIHGHGLWRGSVETIGEGFGAGIWKATGHYIAGGTLWARYNFVPAESHFSPYIQIGLGGTSMDIDHKYDGHNFNFNLDATGGLRYFYDPRISLNLELRYQHISNANTASHNIGINAIGPAAGISWYF